jgi:spore coat protein CotF
MMQPPYGQQTPTRGTQQNQPQQSTGLPQVKGPELNDRDRLNDILSTEKYLTTAYNIAVNEASTQQLYQVQMQMLTELHQCQRDLFNLMSQKGWYKTDPAPAQQVTQTAQQFANYRTQFPYA